MSYRIAGIDVHKKMLAVVVSDVEVDSEYQFERVRYSSSPEHLRLLAEWLIAQQIEEVVMESTAQYWKPVWGALERYWKPICQEREGAGPKSGTLHLAQAQSNRGRRGRKKDFPDAERLVKRLVADELVLSFVPDTEQRLWRTVTRRMLKALAEGETNPATLAAMADKNLRATQAQLRDALGACTELKPIYRRLLKMFLEELQFIDQQISKLDQELASLLSQQHDAVVHLAEIPGLGVDSAQQIIAEVGAGAATFPSAKQLSSWVGACPGEEESAEVSKSHRSPKGNRHMRRILNQAANAAAKSKGTIFEIAYRRLVSRLGHNQTIGAIAHRLCRLIWIILHRGVRYEERGPSVNAKTRRHRTNRMIRELRNLGYRVEPLVNTV